MISNYPKNKQIKFLKKLINVKTEKYIVLPDKSKSSTDKFFKLNEKIRVNYRLLYCTKIEQVEQEIHYIFGYR